MTRTLGLAGGVLAAGMVLGGSSAHAHIVMEGALRSRTAPGAIPGLDNEQKMSPCDGARAAGPVYTFQPGATITLAISETIAHPSYFRIAFDNDGENDFKEPASIKPIDPSRACPFDADDHCGKSDFCNVYDPNGARVLWDNLDPHKDGGGKHSWNVILPNVECENCTLQVIQVMEDTVHGAYCPQGSCANSSASLEDIYHRCINIKLKRGATNSPGVTTSSVNNKGIDCATSAMPDAGVGSSDAGVGSSDAGPRSDAGATSDAGAASSTGGAAGGTAGSGTGTGIAGGGVAGGGVAGTTGTSSGTIGGTTPSGTPSATTATTTGAATTGTGTATPNGTAGAVAGAAGGTVGAPAGGATAGAPAAASDDDGGCSVSFGASDKSTAGAGLLLLGLGLLMRRRQRRSA